MKKIAISNLTALDCSTISDIIKFSAKKMDRPNEITAMTTWRRKDGFTFYHGMVGSPLFNPRIILTARYKTTRFTLAPIDGKISDKDLDLIISMIKLENGSPNFNLVVQNMRDAGKLAEFEII